MDFFKEHLDLSKFKTISVEDLNKGFQLGKIFSTQKKYIGKSIRGMSNVSPLAAYKFNNLSIDETFNKYFPDAKNLQSGNTNIVTDVGVPLVRNGFTFDAENYYFDMNNNGKYGDSGDILAFKLLLFVSTDGLKVRECYEVTNPKDDEVILFLETDEGLSKQVLFGKMSEKVRKQFTDEKGNLKTNLFDDKIMQGVRKYYSEANQAVIEELMKNGYIKESSIKEGFFKILKYISIGSTAVPKYIGWISEKLGEGIDLLKIPEQFWDTENEAYFLKKENAIKNFKISAEIIKTLEKILKNKDIFDVSDLIPDIIENKISYSLMKLKTTIQVYNHFVESEIEKIYGDFDNPTANFIFENIAEELACLAGFWDGAVDFISGLFKFIGLLLQAPFNIVTNYETVLEVFDNFWDALWSADFWKNLWENIKITYQKIKKDLKSTNSDDYNWVRISYFSGFGLATIISFFVPIAQVTNVLKVGKLGEIIAKFTSEISNGFVKGANIISQKSAQAYENSLKIVQEILELFAKGGKNLEAFFEKIWKKIVDWFLENKKFISLVDEIEFFLLPLIKILRKNSKYLDSIGFIKLIGRPLGRWLVLEQEAAINLYTKSYYLAFNKALRKIEGVMTEEYKAMQKVLDNALEKLPTFKQGKDPLLRSAKFSESKIKELFREGKEFTDAGFFSTTHSEKALLRWMKNNAEDNVLFKVYGKNGKLIEMSSDLPGEAEILFKSNTTFLVESVKPGKHPLNELEQVIIIVLKEK